MGRNDTWKVAVPASLTAAVLALVITSAAAAYNLLDNWSSNVVWVDPGGGGSGTSLLADTWYNYPGSGDHNFYNTAEFFDDPNGCQCFTYVAAKAYMTDGDWSPWYETAWDIDPDYANATIGRTDGLHVQGKYQAYPFTGWTTYFEYGPVLPN